MELADFTYLQSAEASRLIEAHLEDSPDAFALRMHAAGHPAAALASQLKALQKARIKLPRHYAARCILPLRAVEQASSQLSAAHKPWGQGRRALDLCCGLGLDTLAMAGHYEQVIALEADPVLAQVTAHNLRLIGLTQVEVIHSTAEAFLSSYDGPGFDLIFGDPDRRDAAGRRQILLEHCQPNVRQLMPRLLELAPRLLIKGSPMLDLHALEKDYPQLTQLYVLSQEGECKEVLLELARSGQAPVTRHAWALDAPGGRLSFDSSQAETTARLGFPDLDAMPLYLYEADVALYKAGLAAAWFGQFAPEGSLMNDPQGYCFSQTPWPDFPGRSFQVLEAQPYKPAAIRKWLAKSGIRQVLYSRRHFDIPLEKVRAQLKVPPGGQHYLILTSDPQRQRWAFLAERISEA